MIAHMTQSLLSVTYSGCLRWEYVSSFYVKSCLSPDDKFLLSGSSDGNAFIWEVSSLEVFPPYVFLLNNKLLILLDWSSRSSSPSVIQHQALQRDHCSGLVSKHGQNGYLFRWEWCEVVESEQDKGCHQQHAMESDRVMLWGPQRRWYNNYIRASKEKVVYNDKE